MGTGHGEVTKIREAADVEGSGTQGWGEAEILTAKERGRQRLLSSRQDCACGKAMRNPDGAWLWAHCEGRDGHGEDSAPAWRPVDCHFQAGPRPLLSRNIGRGRPAWKKHEG